MFTQLVTVIVVGYCGRTLHCILKAIQIQLKGINCYDNNRKNREDERKENKEPLEKHNGYEATS